MNLCPFICAAAAALTSSSLAAAQDLSDVYPATREWVQQGLFPVCTPEDVWELKSFEVGLGGDLTVSCKKATVTFGRDGTDVLWAVVLPERPGKIDGDLAPEEGDARSILLRFSPYEIGRIFPEKTVRGRAEPWRRAAGMRVAAGKMVWKWCTPAGNPTIVPRPCTLVDVETDEDERYLWLLDRDQGTVTRSDDFLGKVTPPATSIERRAAEAAFDEVWETFDREYAGFVTLPDVDWKRVGKESRKALKEVSTTYELAALLADMLAQLEDLHVWVKDGDTFLPGYTRERLLNANWEATKKAVGRVNEAGRNLVWGRTKDGYGYLGVHGLNDPELPDHADRALEELRDTKGLVVDLRFNGGGDELLARKIAGRFLEAPVVYSRNRYRNGPKHDQLGEILDRAVEPRGPWRYEAPVVCIWGARTLSSAESMALMFHENPAVTTMGAASGGSSANPRRLELECGITVNVPRWLDLLPDGTPLERHGAIPDVVLDHPSERFTNDSDPVIDAALARLCE